MAKTKENLKTIFDDIIYSDPNLSVLSDNPISLGDMKADIFDLCYHLGPVYNLIRSPNTQTPLTIGINGKWGTGKSTAMKWLFEVLDTWNKSSQSKDKIKTRNVWFCPWKYHNKEDVLKGLIAEVIINAIDSKNATKETLIKAVKLLLTFAGETVIDILEDKEFRFYGFNVKFNDIKKIINNYKKANHPEKAYLNEYEQTLKKWIKDIIPKQTGRMVIFIDDLDRSMPDIALQVLESLKLYLDIDRLIFIIGMDREVVKESVAAYYKEKEINNIDPGEYLDKMLQLELNLSPQKKQMDTYLDDLLEAVNYKQNIDEKNAKRKDILYQLFRKLISKHGGRNPRKIKRLINSSLIRGAGAERITKQVDNDKPTFEQGVQIFFIQTILAKEYNLADLVGDGDRGDTFFSMWFEIVRNNDSPVGIHKFSQELRKLQNELDKEPSRITPTESISDGPSIFDEEGKVKVSEIIPELYHELIRHLYENSLPIILLANEDLGDLMQIEYSMAIAEKAKDQQINIDEQDDATIIREAIAKQLKKEPAELIDGDYENVTSLDLSFSSLKDMKLLANLKNLRKLVLYNTQIDNIRPLYSLTNLQELHLDSTLISKLDDLVNLKKLQNLTLAKTKIADINPLAGLTDLHGLNLNGTNVSDLTPLEGLVNLEWLTLSQTHVSNIEPLEVLANLEELFLDYSEVYNLEPVQSLTKLQKLRLNKTNVSDIEPLSELTGLQELFLHYTNVSDLEPLKNLTKLYRLGVNNTLVSNLEPLTNLTNLIALDLHNDKVSDIKPLRNLMNLERLYLMGTDVSDFTPISSITNLRLLDLNNTNIDSLEPLKELNSLRELRLLNCNNITIEQIIDLQKSLPDCMILSALTEDFLVNNTFSLIFNPKFSKTKNKIMKFANGGEITDGRNNNETTWRIKKGYLELLNSEGKVHSRFYYNPFTQRFDHTNDKDTRSIRGQYMVLK